MIQNNLQYLLKHPDISLEAPASNDYIEVNDAATGETLAWVKPMTVQELKPQLTVQQSASCLEKANCFGAC